MWPFNKNKKMLAIRAHIAAIAVESYQSTTVEQMKSVVQKTQDILEEAYEYESTTEQYGYLLAAIQMRLCLMELDLIWGKYR